MTKCQIPSRLEYVDKPTRNDDGKVNGELLRRWLTGRTAGPEDLTPSLALARAAAPPRGRGRLGTAWFHAVKGRSTHAAAGWRCGALPRRPGRAWLR
jgi:hypothetical protein